MATHKNRCTQCNRTLNGIREYWRLDQPPDVRFCSPVCRAEYDRTVQMTTRKARVELKSKDAAGVLDELQIVQRYLPSNYQARLETHENPPYILIEGEDDHGWTMDSYVIPRLGSGLIVAREIGRNRSSSVGD